MLRPSRFYHIIRYLRILKCFFFNSRIEGEGTPLTLLNPTQPKISIITHVKKTMRSQFSHPKFILHLNYMFKLSDFIKQLLHKFMSFCFYIKNKDENMQAN